MRSVYSSRESGYYPPGAEFDPFAPYNQVDPPEREFDLDVSLTMSKTATVVSDNYDEYYSYASVNEPQKTYEEQEFTITEILDFARRCAEYMLDKHDFSLKSKYDLKSMLESSKGWKVDDILVEQQ